MAKAREKAVNDPGVGRGFRSTECVANCTTDAISKSLRRGQSSSALRTVLLVGGGKELREPVGVGDARARATDLRGVVLKHLAGLDAFDLAGDRGLVIRLQWSPWLYH